MTPNAANVHQAPTAPTTAPSPAGSVLGAVQASTRRILALPKGIPSAIPVTGLLRIISTIETSVKVERICFSHRRTHSTLQSRVSWWTNPMDRIGWLTETKCWRKTPRRPLSTENLILWKGSKTGIVWYSCCYFVSIFEETLPKDITAFG